MTRTSAFPGFGAPAVGFDTPFEMLEACHERVERTLGLLQKIRDYLGEHACDDSVRQAARDVMRYFDIAAPLHHEDEELHVFPPLLAHGDPAVAEQVRQLQQDHQLMVTDWALARPGLLALAEGRAVAFSAEDEAALARFAGRYDEHARIEEDSVYPAARALLAPQVLQAMGQEMPRRRGAAS